jgi:hypothetical protein
LKVRKEREYGEWREEADGGTMVLRANFFPTGLLYFRRDTILWVAIQVSQ